MDHISSDNRTPAFSIQPIMRIWSLFAVAGIFSAAEVHAQVPSILWSTNVGARLFAVDEQTNAYAYTSNRVIQINSQGESVQTNAFCPRPGVAQRDSEGNFYFAGVLPNHVNDSMTWIDFDPQDFGGIVLSNQAVFLAKYSPAGALLWATNFGPSSGSVRQNGIWVDTLSVEGTNALVGYSYFQLTHDHFPTLVRVDTQTGEFTWSSSVPQSCPYAFCTINGHVRSGPIVGTNGVVLEYSDNAGWMAQLSSFDTSGQMIPLANWNVSDGGAYAAAQPIRTSEGEVYNIEAGFLTKRDSTGAILWTRSANGWTIGTDQWNGVHLSSSSGVLQRFDSDGNLIWSKSLMFPVNSLILDPHGNRIISLSDGEIVRIGSETTSLPEITGPLGQTVFSGSNAVLSAVVSGFSPFQYSWWFGNSWLTNTPTPVLALAAVSPSQSGYYTLIVTNVIGAATSNPAFLRVKSVGLFNGGQLLTNGTYVFASPPTLTIRSAFTNGSEFYTLDGAAPDFSSMHYSGPFTVNQSATVRAIGYNADFSQAEEADSVTVIIPTKNSLDTYTSGGGTVTLTPPGGSYSATDVVNATATSADGYSFLYWTGDASGNDPSIMVSMERSKTIRAVFGTTLSTTVAGNGYIQVFPATTLHANGSTVRLTGVPDLGNYFGFWGNAATGNTNPLYFTISAPTQTISSIFGTISGGQVTLTTLVNGHGRVIMNPRANLYSANANVTLTAIPDAGETFLNWSGDAGGSQNPLSVVLSASKVITASFTTNATLQVDTESLEAIPTDGMRLKLTSDPGSVYHILASTNLFQWSSLGWVTNAFGEVQISDTNAASFDKRFYKAEP